MSEPTVLTRAQVAALLGFKDADTTDRMVKKHADFPKAMRWFSRCPRWRRQDVEAWIAKQAKAAQVVREVVAFPRREKNIEHLQEASR